MQEEEAEEAEAEAKALEEDPVKETTSSRQPRELVLNLDRMSSTTDPRELQTRCPPPGSACSFMLAASMVKRSPIPYDWERNKLFPNQKFCKTSWMPTHPRLPLEREGSGTLS